MNFERKILKLLKIYFENNKSKMNILLSSKSKEIQRYEISFYKKYFGFNCNFIKTKFWWDPYTTIDNYENIIFIDSTLDMKQFQEEKSCDFFFKKKS